MKIHTTASLPYGPHSVNDLALPLSIGAFSTPFWILAPSQRLTHTTGTHLHPTSPKEDHVKDVVKLARFGEERVYCCHDQKDKIYKA